VAGFGKLYLFVPENTHLQRFAVLNGDLKTVVGAQALSLIGPPDQPEIIDGELGLARKMWRAPTEEPGGVLWETGTDRRQSFGVKLCGLH